MDRAGLLVLAAHGEVYAYPTLDAGAAPLEAVDVLEGEYVALYPPPARRRPAHGLSRGPTAKSRPRYLADL